MEMIRCPFCSFELEGSAELLGCKVQCPKCQQKFYVEESMLEETDEIFAPDLAGEQCAADFTPGVDGNPGLEGEVNQCVNRILLFTAIAGAVIFFLIFVIRWSMRESIQQAADERLAAAEQVKKVDTKKQENKQ